MSGRSECERLTDPHRRASLGNRQQARLVTWVAMRRVESKDEYDWQADRWYTLKMRVDLDGGAATAPGKVRPRGESEPSVWTIELVDPLGNTAPLNVPGPFSETRRCGR